MAQKGAKNWRIGSQGKIGGEIKGQLPRPNINPIIIGNAIMPVITPSHISALILPLILRLAI